MAEKNLRENPFRDEIYDYLLEHGYKKSYMSDYDYKHALDTSKLFEFLESTQGEELQKLKDTYGATYKEKYIELLCDKIEDRGLIKALTEWVEDYASNTKFSLVYFKTGLESMSENIELYNKNIFSVCKEFAYEDKENSYRVDLALFINGIPVDMIELKKQTAGQKAGFEGTKQFKTTRDPNQLCFSFNKRTLVYFAVDEMVAFMTTKLDKKETKFFPFNLGDEDGAGNPVVKGKHSTHYLWEDILQKDMLLRIIREFMFIDDEGNMIFPRYHQLRAVLRAEGDVKNNGVGGRYLIWHSAGSGKTKTIAWLAKRLINLNEIHTVIIISDRTVIDGQLGAEMYNVDGNLGIAQHVDKTSSELLSLINKGRNIIVTTLQKFRPILNEIQRYEDRKYAIIIDEAHSSTAGKSMSKASETLTGKSLKEAVEMDDVYENLEDGQNQILKNKDTIKNTNNVSYFAFTATPKKETVELFGSRTELGKTYFDKYSMKQAIEEKYILNPLQCYTKYSSKYRIDKLKDDDTEYDSARSQQAIFNYITTSEEVVNMKIRIIMDDFVEKRLSWLDGKAKAMIVTPSRKHAVLYKLAVDEYLKKHGCSFKTCVAFTGTIELDGLKFTEEEMNAEFREQGVPYDIKSIIANHDELRIVIVADKLQTGFDENKLCVMYLDKKLSSAVKAVQTISRLNRPAKNKKTYVLDFVNNQDDIKAYFTMYYGGEIYLPTENETDPNILFKKRDTILDYFVITMSQIEEIYQNIQGEETSSGDLTSILATIKKSYDKLEDTQKKIFLGELHKFSKLFYYISIVYNSWNEDMKNITVVFDVVYNFLYEQEDSEVVDPEALVRLIDFSAQVATENESLILQQEDVALDKLATEVTATERAYSVIDEIIEKFNLKYADAEKEIGNIVSELSEDDSLVSNVRDSNESAYEAAIADRVTSKITDGLLDSTLSGDTERADFYAELGNDRSVIVQITNAVIRKIKNMLVAS
ncbi:MAG: type I restriction endonuclease subunit R [Clostridia bacterium]|nr:type I restriction endonuclease subunit R [Clostridia bacterium]